MSSSAIVLNPGKDQDFSRTIQFLRDGEVVGLPTETVYGLAADARNVEAVKKIFAAKGRPADHPLIVHIESFAKLGEWVAGIPRYAKELADAFWPGPLTMLCNKAEHVLDEVTGGLPSVGLRVPNHPVFLKILSELNTGLAAPSANPYKGLSPTLAQHVIDDLGTMIPAVVDGGKCDRGVESTIVDLTGAVPRILRPGPITRQMIEAVLGIEIEAPIVHGAHVPGNVLEHYQPRTPAALMRLSSIQDHIAHPANRGKSFVVVHYSDFVCSDLLVAPMRLPFDKAGYEKALYATLHAADRLGAEEILIERLPEGPDWVAVLDRLRRATASTASKRRESIAE